MGGSGGRIIDRNKKTIIMNHKYSPAKFRIREVKMSYGEIRFIPEKGYDTDYFFGNHTNIVHFHWNRIGDQEYYLNMEQAKQQIDLHKMNHQNENYTEVIHEID